MPDADAAPIAGIVLAAGRSVRMGRNKLLLELDGEPLVRRSARLALEAGLDPVVVVVGFEGDRVADALAGLGCTVVTNPDFGGPSSLSLHAGLRALPADTAGALVLLPDMARVTPAMVQAVVAAARGSAAPVVASRYGPVVAPPLFFRSALFPELLAWTGDGGGKAVIQAHADEAVHLDWPPARLDDLDTPEDLRSFVEG